MDKKLNVLFLCSWYPNRVLPTNGNFIQRHAEAVNTLHNVSVVHIITDQNANQNIEIDSKNINGVDTHIAYLKPTNNPIVKCIRYYKSYKKILKKLEQTPNILHLNVLYPFGILALYSKFFLKTPFLVSEHWSGYKPILNKKISSLKKAVMKLVTANANFICPVSNELAKTMQDFGLKGNYSPVPNVVDTFLFTPSKE
ncbi:glycosyltransferase, partial [Bacteroidota bacterium]